MRESGVELSVGALRRLLVERLAEHLQMPTTEIMTDVPLAEYGLSSVYAVSIAGEIEDHLGLPVDPTIMWDNPSIDMLSKALCEELNKAL